MIKLIAMHAASELRHPLGECRAIRRELERPAIRARETNRTHPELDIVRGRRSAGEGARGINRIRRRDHRPSGIGGGR